jgi:3-hydroxyisobutyrate dehydrogenase
MLIGFVGTGFMGGAIAGHLLETGHSLLVYDARKSAMQSFVAKGAQPGSSPREVAQRADLIFTCVPGPAEVEDVALGPNGIMEGLHAGLIYIDLSTSTPQLIRKIGQLFGERGVNVLDAPVSGGTGAAAVGKLAVYVGGAPEAYERAKPVLLHIGNPVHCGPLGCGEVVKLCNNLLGLTVMATLPEAFALGIKGGVNTKTLFDCFAAGIGETRMMHLGFEPFLKGTDTAGSSSGMILKDLKLALSLGDEFGVPLQLCRLARQRFADALEAGLGEQPAALMERQANVVIRASWSK